MQQFFEYAPEVEQALRERKPILALESTLITHGLPYPQNIETAKALEKIAKDLDVTPATIAIMHGKIKIGLTAAELDNLVHDKLVVKASVRDIPFVLSQGLSAGTTVAATIFCADAAGIKVFATGGIGGVHRGHYLDVSADLIELARIPIAVICSGAKAILDLPKTLEFLETFSIPIVGYRTDSFPAFFSAVSEYHLPAKVENIPALVKLLKIYWSLGLASSVIVANPIPEEDEIPYDIIEPVINNALERAEKTHVSGKEITPFLLTEIAKATGGQSLDANIKLLKNNVKIGSMTAHALVYS